jgi:anti-anti-sigma regulatory factor
VTTDNPILIGLFDGFSWIRCEGKGSFVNSPAVKAFGDERINAGETCLIVDLGNCTSMDSTFMGTLAGMATRLSARPAGALQIADAGERNRRSLEDLGLDFLMEINPATAVWRGKLDSIRSALKPPQPQGAHAQVPRARHVLEAHQVLSELNDKNAREFEDVVTMLENELAGQDKPATPSEPKPEQARTRPKR